MLTSFFILSEMCRMNQHLCHHNEVKRKEVNKPLWHSHNSHGSHNKHGQMSIKIQPIIAAVQVQ